MKRSWLKLLVGAAVLFGTAVTAAAQVPGTVPFTGRVSNSSGPIDGSVSLSFSIFDAASGGTAVWSESYPAATASQGLVFINLGSQTTLDASVFDTGVKYLEVTVNSTTLTPRLPIGSVPYAIRAGAADDAATVGGLAPADLQRRVTGTCASGAVSQIAANGTVTCVPTGTTYTGTAPVTVSGSTISLSTSGCANGQALKYNGSAFACANDANTTYTGTAPINVSGSTISLSTSGCSSGQVLKYNGSAFACAADSNTTYSNGTGISISGTTVSVDSTIVARKDAAAGNQAFDTNTLYLDYTNNRVGVGTSGPAQALDVNGNARANDFLYTTPRTAHYYVSGSAFHQAPSAGSNWNIGQLYGYLSGTSSTFLISPLNLPSGSTITGLACYVEDAEAVDLNGSFSVQKWTYGGTNFVSSAATLAIKTTGSSTSTQTISTSANALFDNSAAGYYLYLSYSWSGNTTGANHLYGCMITYTMPRAGY